MPPAKQAISRDSSGRFEPGVSGNPSGRPKGAVSLSTLLGHHLRDNPDDADRIVQELISIAKDPEHPYWRYAVKIIFDRVDGKVKNKVGEDQPTTIILQHCLPGLGDGEQSSS